MPIRTIQVIEYECAKCHYKWINRVNGKDKPKPLRCSSCKKWNWEGEGEGEGEGKDEDTEDMRSTLREIESTYPSQEEIDAAKNENKRVRRKVSRICQTYLHLYPRPTNKELRKVFEFTLPLEIRMKMEKPHLHFIDHEKFNEICKQEEELKKKRHEIMRQLIDSRQGQIIKPKPTRSKK